jgi:hypothetical protein
MLIALTKVIDILDRLPAQRKFGVRTVKRNPMVSVVSLESKAPKTQECHSLKSVRSKRPSIGQTPSETLEMCVAEPGRILETRPKQTIHANMGGPNQPMSRKSDVFTQMRAFWSTMGLATK